MTTAEASTTSRDTVGLRGFLNKGGIWRLVLVVVVYFAIYLGAGLVFAQFDNGLDEKDVFSSVGAVFFQITGALIVGAIVLVAFCSYMGWTKDLFARQTVYRSKWMWIAPIIVGIPIVMRLFGIDYGLYAADVVAFVFFTGLMIGFVEELLYRGIGVKMLRTGGHGEFVVAVVSSLLFALSHSVNFLGGQEAATVFSTMGYTFAFGVFMYLTMRVTGLLIVAMVMHGLTDPTTMLATGGVDEVAHGTDVDGLLAGAGLFTFLLIVLGYVLVLFVRGRSSEAEPVAASA